MAILGSYLPRKTWNVATACIIRREALEGFIKAAQATYLGRLFAQDALEGLRLMDLIRETFDVVVMNPPFGETGTPGYSIEANYGSVKSAIDAVFVTRAGQIFG